MEIERSAILQLENWKNSKNRKPLIVQGARQVGKTWLIKKFGRDYFDGFAYFNFDEEPGLKQFFSQTKDSKQLLQFLTSVHGKPILPEKTLIFLDEIQECKDALNSLKYFCENAPEYCIISAGSLLGVAMNQGASFPVGKVDFMTLYPIRFVEFLKFANSNLHTYLVEKSDLEPIPDIFFHQLVELFKSYFISGGMPESILALLEQKDMEAVQQSLRNILNSYQLDFSKHVENKLIPKIAHVWDSIPSQLAKENKKFVYQLVHTGARAREYEDALLWLSQAGLIHRIFCSKKPGLPIKAYDDLSAFKIYMNDVGLLRRLSALDPRAISEGNRLFTEFKGALTENFVAQSFIAQFEETPRYWTSDFQAEIDFLIQYKNEIIPIEVKSDSTIQSKSLSFYDKKFEPKIRLRYSLKNLQKDGNLINIPLFMVDFSKRILDKEI